MPRPSVGEPSVPGRLVDEIGAEWEPSADDNRVWWRGFTPLWEPPEAFREPGGAPTPMVIAEVIDDRVRSIVIRWNERTAKLWWVEVPETSADPPALNIVAYDTPALPPGTVIDDTTFTSLPVRASMQAGAYRWWPSTGEVHQMYVAPEGRRQGVGIALGTFAWTYAWLRGWPAQFTGGYRTELGEALIETAKPWWNGRTGPRSHISPPMTPAEQAEERPG
jgi:GNAT superfamily N-acetyltransferase